MRIQIFISTFLFLFRLQFNHLGQNLFIKSTTRVDLVIQFRPIVVNNHINFTKNIFFVFVILSIMGRCYFSEYETYNLILICIFHVKYSLISIRKIRPCSAGDRAPKLPLMTESVGDDRSG
jgi:hypothetical protein